MQRRNILIFAYSNFDMISETSLSLSDLRWNEYNFSLSKSNIWTDKVLFLIRVINVGLF